MKLELIIENAVRKAINEYKNKSFIFEEKQQLWPLSKWNGYVVLRHDSSAKIKNGVINRCCGKTNHYSNRTDTGNYFWGSDERGKDNSNIHDNTYYCLVPEEDVYDMMKNEKGYSDLREAVTKEKYVAANWPGTKNAVVVVTLLSTPISYIDYSPKFSYDGEIRGLYDSNWNLLRVYNVPADSILRKRVFKKLKLTKDIKIPEFLNFGYSYDGALDYYNKYKKIYGWN